MKFVGIFTLLLLLCAQSGIAQTNSSSEVVFLSQEENQFYLMLNQFRAELGLPTLQIHVYLQNAAKKHSEWMSAQNFLTHFGPVGKKTAFSRMEDEGYVNYTFAGENVSCGRSDATAAFRDFAFSPKHLSNMINPHFHHLGISRTHTDIGPYYYYWTTDFGSITDLDLDPPAVTDLNKIRTAIETVSGSIPTSQKVELPIEESVPAPVDVQPKATNPNLYSRIQCMIPYALARNNLSYVTNADVVLDITPNDIGSYQGTVNYFQNGLATNYYPVSINNVSVVKNSSYPILFIFSAPTGRTGGFMIQMNTEKSSAQFDAYPTSLGVNGSVLCTYKI